MENSRSRLGKQYCPINIVLVCANRCYGEGSGNPQSTGHLNLALKKKRVQFSLCHSVFPYSFVWLLSEAGSGNWLGFKRSYVLVSATFI